MITAYHHSAATLNLLRAMNYTQYTSNNKFWILTSSCSTEPEHYFHLLEQLYHSQHHIINKQPDTLLIMLVMKLCYCIMRNR